MNLTAPEWRLVSERLYMLTFDQFVTALGIEADGYALDAYAEVKALARALARVAPTHLAKLVV